MGYNPSNPIAECDKVGDTKGKTKLDPFPKSPSFKGKEKWDQGYIRKEKILKLKRCC